MLIPTKFKGPLEGIVDIFWELLPGIPTMLLYP